MSEMMTPDEVLDEFCLFDDTFMSWVFERNMELAQWLLQLILENEEIELTEVIGQCMMKNLVADGRKIFMDLYAKDQQNRCFNVEVQRSNDGAREKRARYHGAHLDVRMLNKNQHMSQLKDSYMIFITEKDVRGDGLPIYHVGRTVLETGQNFQDGSNIIYVNGAYKDENSVIGKLGHDFKCKNPDDMHYQELADAVRYYKQDEKGREEVCELMDNLMENYGKQLTRELTRENEEKLRIERENARKERENTMIERERAMRAEAKLEEAEAEIQRLLKLLCPQ